MDVGSHLVIFCRKSTIFLLFNQPGVKIMDFGVRFPTVSKLGHREKMYLFGVLG